MSNKYLTVEEFSDWAEKRSPAEIEQRAIELQDQLVSELRESAGVSREDYERAGTDERLMMAGRGVDVWLAEDANREAAEIAGDREAQDDVLRELAANHPNHFPSVSNGNLFRDRYCAAWIEANPGLPIFWEANACETLYRVMSEQAEFQVERIFKSE